MTARQEQGPPSTPSARPNRAIRLTFAYEGESIRLVDRQSLEKRTAPSDPVDAREKRSQSGFWVEVQGGRSRTLYRLVMSNPIETSIEVPTGDEEQPFTRQTVAQPRGVFFVLVPDLAEAEAVALFSSPIDPAEPRAAEQPAREIARFGIREEPKDNGNTAGYEGGAS
jgi:hypothetical protein